MKDVFATEDTHLESQANVMHPNLSNDEKKKQVRKFIVLTKMLQNEQKSNQLLEDEKERLNSICAKESQQLRNRDLKF